MHGSAVILAVTDATKAFHRDPPWHRRRIEVLRGASLHVDAGELVGLVGKNGSGKSTLMQIVVGLQARDGGTVDRPPRMGYCPQLPLLWDKLTVTERRCADALPPATGAGHRPANLRWG